MERRLLRLARELRGEGVSVPPSEVVTASRALLAVGVADRADLRDALMACLVKDREGARPFLELFDRHFPPAPSLPVRRKKRGGAAGPGGEGAARPGGPGAGGGAKRPESRPGERPRESPAAAGEAGRETRDSAHRAAEDDSASRGGGREERRRVEGLMNRPFRDRWSREEEALVSQAVENLLLRTKVLPGRRTRTGSKGALDIKGTLRANLRHGGVPFTVVRRRRRPARKDLLLLADVSGSVRRAANLLLRALATLRDGFSGVRVFVYVDRPAEIRRAAAGRPFAALGEDLGSLLPLHALSDHGETLRRLNSAFPSAVRRRTVAVILGDGRNNGFPPQEWEVEKLARRAAHLLWIVPEKEALWGTGDSDMPLYAPLCRVALAAPTPAALVAAVNALPLRGRRGRGSRRPRPAPSRRPPSLP